MIPWPVLILYIYGILLIVGGLMGYVKAQSVPSLVAGLVCGFIALFLGYRYAWHFAPHAAFILAPVSYTHLDVYKRQRLALRCFIER